MAMLASTPDTDASCKMGSVHSEPDSSTSNQALSSPHPATSLNDFPMQYVINMDDMDVDRGDDFAKCSNPSPTHSLHTSSPVPSH